MRPLSTSAVLKPCETAADAIIIPEPEPITKMSNRSTTISTTNKIKRETQINFSSVGLQNSFITISTINSLRLVMSKQKKAEDEKKKKEYYSKSEKKAKEVKK
jgi:hypothetical protein